MIFKCAYQLSFAWDPLNECAKYIFCQIIHTFNSETDEFAGMTLFCVCENAEGKCLFNTRYVILCFFNVRQYNATPNVSVSSPFCPGFVNWPILYGLFIGFCREVKIMEGKFRFCLSPPKYVKSLPFKCTIP